MTTIPLVSAPGTRRRNWGGVMIAIAGGYELVSTVLNATARSIPNFPTNLFGTIFVLQFAAVLLVPFALLVGFAPLAFGALGMRSIAGPALSAKIRVFLAGVVGCIAQFVIAGLFIAEIGQTSDAAISGTTSATIVVGVFALLIGVMAAVVIARAGVATGYARWSLFVAVALIAVTIALGDIGLAGQWQDVPRAAGILALGVSYWRVGLPATASVPALSNANPKSLAE
jgi:hypothetical protein